ncbi:unnamed protein product, partial [Phaeothamnion confervicola]
RHRRDPLFLYKSAPVCEDCYLVYAELASLALNATSRRAMAATAASLHRFDRPRSSGGGFSGGGGSAWGGGGEGDVAARVRSSRVRTDESVWRPVRGGNALSAGNGGGGSSCFAGMAVPGSSGSTYGKEMHSSQSMPALQPRAVPAFPETVRNGPGAYAAARAAMEAGIGNGNGGGLGGCCGGGGYNNGGGYRDGGGGSDPADGGWVEGNLAEEPPAPAPYAGSGIGSAQPSVEEMVRAREEAFFREVAAAGRRKDGGRSHPLAHMVASASKLSALSLLPHELDPNKAMKRVLRRNGTSPYARPLVLVEYLGHGGGLHASAAGAGGAAGSKANRGGGGAGVPAQLSASAMRHREFLRVAMDEVKGQLGEAMSRENEGGNSDDGNKRAEDDGGSSSGVGGGSCNGVDGGSCNGVDGSDGAGGGRSAGYAGSSNDQGDRLSATTSALSRNDGSTGADIAGVPEDDDGSEGRRIEADDDCDAVGCGGNASGDEVEAGANSEGGDGRGQGSPGSDVGKSGMAGGGDDHLSFYDGQAVKSLEPLSPAGDERAQASAETGGTNGSEGSVADGPGGGRPGGGGGSSSSPNSHGGGDSTCSNGVDLAGIVVSADENGGSRGEADRAAPSVSASEPGVESDDARHQAGSPPAEHNHPQKPEATLPDGGLRLGEAQKGIGEGAAG